MVDVTYLLTIQCEDQAALAGASTVAITETLQKPEGALAERSKVGGASSRSDDFSHCPHQERHRSWGERVVARAAASP
jgi:hypothetical protein